MFILSEINLFFFTAIHHREEGDFELMPVVESQDTESVGFGRWKAFENFKRMTSQRKTLMKSKKGMPIKDFLPGKFDTCTLHLICCPGIYSFSDIVNYSDLPPMKPASTVVSGVK